MKQEEAQTIANEVLRIIVYNPDYCNIKNLMSRELDIVESGLDSAASVLFMQRNQKEFVFRFAMSIQAVNEDDARYKLSKKADFANCADLIEIREVEP